MSETPHMDKPADYWEKDWDEAPKSQPVVRPKPDFWDYAFELSQSRQNGTPMPDRVPSEWEKSIPPNSSKSIEEAGEMLTPLIPLFVENMSSKFLLQDLMDFDYPIDRTTLSWIDNAELWSSFWEVADPKPVLLPKRPMDPSLTIEEKARTEKLLEKLDKGQEAHAGAYLWVYIDGAACSGNMSFFTTMPPHAMGVVRSVLSDTRVLIEPNVLTWLQQNDPKCEPVTKQQSALLKDLDWLPTGYDQGPDVNMRLITRSRGEFSMEESVDLLCRSAQQHKLGTEDLCKLFGFIMLQMDNTIDRKSIIAEIQKSMGEALPADVDLSLIAMCSGYNVGKGEGRQQADIVALGKEVSMPSLDRMISDRLAGETLAGEAPPAALPNTALRLLSTLNVFYPVARPEQLYKAISSSGLNKVGLDINENSADLGYSL